MTHIPTIPSPPHLLPASRRRAGFWLALSAAPDRLFRGVRHLHPLYHGTVCPELRLSARIGQFLPRVRTPSAVWHETSTSPSWHKKKPRTNAWPVPRFLSALPRSIRGLRRSHGAALALSESFAESIIPHRDNILVTIWLLLGNKTVILLLAAAASMNKGMSRLAQRVVHQALVMNGLQA